MADALSTVVFEDGTLRIRAPRAQMAIRWRPEPQAEELSPGRIRTWRPCWPDLRLLRPPGPTQAAAGAGGLPAGDGRAEAFAAFRTEIPTELAASVERFASHQWPLLLLLHRQPKALDLARGNPVLAYCLANGDEFRDTTRAAAQVQAVWYSHRPQRTILGWLGFPATEAMARTMRKIAPEAAAPSVLRCLRNALAAAPEVLARLGHLPAINAGVLGLVTVARLLPLLTPRLLAEVAAAPDEQELPQTSEHLLAATAVLAQIDPGRRVAPVTSIARAVRLAEEADERYRAHLEEQQVRAAARQAAREQARRDAERAAAERRRAQRRAARGAPAGGEEDELTRAELRRRAELLARPYPPPPVPGTPDIVPIASADDLRAEGAEQRHCVASYLFSVLTGGLYVYRVLKPERATLGIIRMAGGTWRRWQLKGPGNALVKPGTVQAVDRWLSGYNLGA